MNPTQAELDEIFRARIARARATPPEEKFLAGAELFEHVCRVMRDGIRDQFPEADEESVEAMLTQRLALARRLENGR